MRKVGDYTSKLVAGMREDLDALSERVKNRNGDDDTEALLAVGQAPAMSYCKAGESLLSAVPSVDRFCSTIACGIQAT